MICYKGNIFIRCITNVDLGTHQMLPSWHPSMTGCSSQFTTQTAEGKCRTSSHRCELWQCMGGHSQGTPHLGVQETPLSIGSLSKLSFYLARGGRGNTSTVKSSWPQSQPRHAAVMIPAERGTISPLPPCFASHKQFFEEEIEVRSTDIHLLSLRLNLCVLWEGQGRS